MAARRALCALVASALAARAPAAAPAPAEHPPDAAAAAPPSSSTGSVLFISSRDVTSAERWALSPPSGEHYVLRAWAIAVAAAGARTAYARRCDAATARAALAAGHARIVVETVGLLTPRFCDALGARGRARLFAFDFWGRLNDAAAARATGACALPAARILLPYPDGRGRFIGYWAHGVERGCAAARAAPRAYGGVVLGKLPRYFDGRYEASAAEGARRAYTRPALEALLADGANLTSTCAPRRTLLGRLGLRADEACNLPPGVRLLGATSPGGFGQLLASSAFLLGVLDPPLSPSPLEALACGAAFINPALRPPRSAAKRARHSQHAALAAVAGPPHVYTVDLANASEVVGAARSAAARRFASHVPQPYSRAATVARARAWLAEAPGEPPPPPVHAAELAAPPAGRRGLRAETRGGGGAGEARRARGGGAAGDGWPPAAAVGSALPLGRRGRAPCDDAGAGGVG